MSPIGTGTDWGQMQNENKETLTIKERHKMTTKRHKYNKKLHLFVLLLCTSQHLLYVHRLIIGQNSYLLKNTVRVNLNIRVSR